MCLRAFYCLLQSHFSQLGEIYIVCRCKCECDSGVYQASMTVGTSSTPTTLSLWYEQEDVVFRS